MKGYKYLIVNVFQATDVFAVDSSNCGLLLKVRCYNATAESEVAINSRNPIWDNRLVLKIPLFDDMLLPPLIITLLDRQSAFFKDDFIGGAIINLDTT